MSPSRKVGGTGAARRVGCQLARLAVYSAEQRPDAGRASSRYGEHFGTPAPGNLTALCGAGIVVSPGLSARPRRFQPR